MTKMATNLNSMLAAKRAPERERVWWSIHYEVAQAAGPRWFTSDLIPSGAIVTEIQIQAQSVVLAKACNVRVYLGVVQSKDATAQEIIDSTKLIPWFTDGTVFYWTSLGVEINERWPHHKILLGSELRFGVALLATCPNGAVVRVSVQYQLP